MLRSNFETTVTTTAPLFGGEPEIRTERRIALNGKACVSLTASCLEIRDGYGETDPLILTYWAEGDEILAAMVDYVAALRRAVDRAAEAGDFLPGRENYSAQRSLENLNRIIGATGCELPCLPVAAA